MASKKITDLAALNTATGDDLIIIVDISGPTTYKMAVSDLFGAVPANVVFTANVTAQQPLTANAATFVGNVTINTSKFLVVNNFIAAKTTTPTTSTDTVTTGRTGLMWSDGNYIYVQANNTHYKRVAISTF